MSSMSMLGRNLSKRDTKLMLKYTKTCLNAYNGYLKKNV